MRSKFLLFSILTCLSMTSFNVAIAAIPQRDARHNRVVPGEASRAAPMRRQPPHSAHVPAQEPARRCNSKIPNWNFNFGLDCLLPICSPAVCCPPPPPCEIHHHHIVCPPPACAPDDDDERAPACHTQREINYEFRWFTTQHLLLHGVFPNLKNIELGACTKNGTLVADGVFLKLLQVKINTDENCKKLMVDLTGDFARLNSLDIFGGCKHIELDLRGRWGQSCTFRIHQGKKTAHIKLPSYAGVVIKMRNDTQITSTEQLWTRPAFSGVEYTNEAYGRTPVTLTIDLTHFRGEVIVE